MYRTERRLILYKSTKKVCTLVVGSGTKQENHSTVIDLVFVGNESSDLFNNEN